MVSLIYLKRPASSSSNDELLHAGYDVREALSVPEAIWLCTQHYARIIVVDTGFDGADTAQLEARYITIKRDAETTVNELLSKLALAAAAESFEASSSFNSRAAN